MVMITVRKKVIEQFVDNFFIYEKELQDFFRETNVV